MDFGIIYQLKTKKYWWLDTILYAVLSLLLATVICYGIFILKISLQEKTLKDIEDKMSRTGTAEQKELEEKVFNYQKKINNFAVLLTNHKIPTNIFKTMERDTLPNVWISSFSTNAEMSQMMITGEAENLNTMSRQIDIFEKNEFIKNIASLATSLDQSSRILFNLSFELDPNIYFPIPEFTDVPILDTTSPSVSSFLNYGSR